MGGGLHIRYGLNVDAAVRETSLQAAYAAMRSAATTTGRKPIVVIAPDETRIDTDDGDADTGATGLRTLATQLKGIAICDAAYSTIVIATAWDNNNGGARTIGIPQQVTTPRKANLPGSSFLAAALVRNDALYGVNDSFSNREVVGITSVNPTRSFEYTDETSDALALRAVYLTSIVRDPFGTWRVVGGTMKSGASPATNPLRYIGVQRMVDAIESRVIEFALDRWNRNMRSNFIPRLVSDVQGYLDLLIGAGILRTGVASPSDENTATTRAAGLVYVSVDVTFPAINEQVNFDVEVALG